MFWMNVLFILFYFLLYHQMLFFFSQYVITNNTIYLCRYMLEHSSTMFLEQYEPATPSYRRMAAWHTLYLQLIYNIYMLCTNFCDNKP